jgi:two-component system sensor histidine kinase KdpD
VLALVIAALVPFRDRLAQSHVTLALLLVVLAAAAAGGRRVGLATAALAFLGFNWFFLAPYGTFALADSLDWFVLFAFLGTSVVASHLFHRVQREADEARERTDEVTTLAALGAEAMAAPRADGALRQVAVTTREAMGVATCRVHVLREGEARDGAPLVSTSTTADPPDPSPGGTTIADADFEPVRIALERGERVAVLGGGVVRVIAGDVPSLRGALADDDARRLLLPLRAGARAIGVLDVEDPRGIALSEPRERLLAALAYYAALGAERARNEQASERLEALRESERIRTAVLASVSHDLRTPLTTIKALAHELGTLGDERSDIIEQEADRLNRFVADILDMSRLASDRYPLAPSVTPLDELVTAALQQVEGSFGTRRIVVQLPGDDAFPLARFDLTHTVRIVVNLLENARKYAPGDAPVELSVARHGAMTQVTVADRGPGVPLEERDRIFDALYRPASSPPDVGSAGLGLAIARALAEAQGGTLTYQPRDGGGSVFTLALPAADLDDIGLASRSEV